MSAIRTLNDFGLDGMRQPPYTGIWIDNRKIAAIGIAVRRGITFHGLALNVNTDLSYFKRIIPCGLNWADVTSVAKELGKEQSAKRVQERFRHHFANLFGYKEIKASEELFDLSGAGSNEESRETTIATTGTTGTF
jgi:lipoyl(octanoyl) transferase